jgi:hypothetical protein
MILNLFCNTVMLFRVRVIISRKHLAKIQERIHLYKSGDSRAVNKNTFLEYIENKFWS